MNKEDVLSWVRSLTDKQFVEFFYEAVAARNTSDVFDGHFVLADAEKVDGEPWLVDFVALPNPAHPRNQGVRWVEDATICQSGTCQECKSEVRGWVYNVICPICGNEVYCT